MIFSFLFIYIFVVNIVYYVVHIVCEVDVITNSLVLYLPFCSTLNKNFFSSLSSLFPICIVQFCVKFFNIVCRIHSPKDVCILFSNF